MLQPVVTTLAALLGFALLFVLERVTDRAAERRYVALLRGQGDLMAKLKALQEEQDDVRRAVRNGQEAMVVLSEQLGMEFGELRKLVTPKPVRKAPARAKP